MTQTKHDYIKYRIEKSDEIYFDAVLLSENARWNSCVNRLYYSSYYLAGALLYKHDIKADTHNGVKTQLFLNFVKRELLSNTKLHSYMKYKKLSNYECLLGIMPMQFNYNFKNIVH